MPVTVLRRGSAFELMGIKALEAQIRDMTAAVCLKKELSSGKKAAITQRAGRMVQEALWEAAEVVRKDAYRRAKLEGWPDEVIETMFAYAGLHSSRAPKSSSLAGAAKRRSWVHWITPSDHPRTRKPWGDPIEVKVRAGGEVQMSLAAMYEHGTSTMNARPALGPAVRASGDQVYGKLAEGYRCVIESFHWNEQ